MNFNPMRGWRAELARFGVMLLLAPLIFVATTPASTRVDESLSYSQRSWLGDRSRLLTGQIGSINEGRYLLDERGRSYTAATREDIGHSIFLANFGLARNLLGVDRMSEKELFHIRGYVAVLAIALLLACRIRGSVIALACLLLTFFASSIVRQDGERGWPQITALALTFVLIDLVWRDVERPQRQTWRSMLRLYSIAFFAGLQGAFRSEATFIVLFPFLAVFGLSAVSVIDRGIRQVRNAAAGWREGAFAWVRSLGERMREGDAGLRGLALSAVVLLGILSTGPAMTVNIALYEAIEQAEHQPLRGKHLLWHPLFVGLGYTLHDAENVAWSDHLGRIEALRANGSYHDFNDDSEAAARDRYLQILARNTPYFVDVYVEKVRQLVFVDAGTPVALVLAIAVLMLQRMISRGRSPTAHGGMTFAIATLAVIAACAAPGLVAGKENALAFFPALAASILFGTWIVGERVTLSGRDASGGGEHWAAVRRALVAAAALVCIVAALVVARVHAIERHRDELTSGLAAGELSFEELLNEYPADAVIAFNRLRRRPRTLIAAGMAERGGGIGEDVFRARKQGPRRLEILHTRRTEETLFLLVRLEDIKFRSAVPVLLDFGDAESTTGPVGAKLPVFTEVDVDVIYLPAPLAGGVRLLAIGGPTDTVESFIVGDVVPESPMLYIQPLERER